MSKKIIGVTVGTTISPKKIEKELNPVKTVNGQAPDENGNVAVVGNNGISATHSWNGTKLTITSASGTSSADLKGEKGDKGDIPATFLPFMTNPKTIFPETFLALNIEQGYNTHRCNIADKIELVTGKEYTVVWNGTSYKCVAVERAEASSIWIGRDPYDYTEDLLPFTIISYTTLMEGTDNARVYDYEGNVTATVAIYSKEEEAYAINPKYIPDMYYTEGEGMAEILPETSYTTDLDGVGYLPHVNLVAGDTYTVIINGTSYKCTAFYATVQGDDAIALGNRGIVTGEDTGEPFMIASAIEQDITTFVALTVDTNSGTVAIYHDTELIHHVPPKYIKDMYYEEIVQDGVIVPPTTAVDNGHAVMGELYVMGAPITLVEGKTYTVIYNGDSYECVATAAELQGESMMAMGDLTVLVTGTPSGAYPFVMAAASFVETAGASIAVIPLDGTTPTIAIYGEKTEIHTIPQKYIDGYAPMYAGERLTLTSTNTRITDANLISFLHANKNANKVKIRCNFGGIYGIVTFQKMEDPYWQSYMSFNSYGGADGFTLALLGFSDIEGTILRGKLVSL